MARPDRAKAIKRLNDLLDEVPSLLLSDGYSQGFQRWFRDVRIVISNTFGEDSRHITEIPTGFAIRGPEYQNDLRSMAGTIESMLNEVRDYWDDNNKNLMSQPAFPQEDTQFVSNKVFVVHGRDEGSRDTVARFLEKLDLEPIILNEQASQGGTIIEKFERHSKVGFAVILMTPDDEGSLRGEEDGRNPRARQNVIFELGFFIGRLGRERVCALTKGENMEIPSDYAGVVYISLDDHGAWKIGLVKELKAVGFDVDANRAL